MNDAIIKARRDYFDTRNLIQYWYDSNSQKRYKMLKELRERIMAIVERIREYGDGSYFDNLREERVKRNQELLEERLRRNLELTEQLRIRAEQIQQRLVLARAAAEARREAQRSYYQNRNKSLASRIAEGLPYYEKMVWTLRDRRPFLDSIIANPHDDGPRLVFSDFLEDQGDETAAAFMRQWDALSLLVYDDRIDLPGRVKSRLTHTIHAPSLYLRGLINLTALDLYGGISNFGWIAVMDVQEMLESIGLSLTPSNSNTMTMVTPKLIRPALARLFPNARKS